MRQLMMAIIYEFVRDVYFPKWKRSEVVELPRFHNLCLQYALHNAKAS